MGILFFQGCCGLGFVPSPTHTHRLAPRSATLFRARSQAYETAIKSRSAMGKCSIVQKIKSKSSQTMRLCAESSPSSSEVEPEHKPSFLVFLDKLTALFPVWVGLGFLIALQSPSLFTWFTSDMLVYTLMFIMLGTGISTETSDFKNVLVHPRKVILGALAQFTIMPIMGYMVSNALALSPAFKVGVLLVATAPGGTASNLVCLLAGGDLALSIVMTSVSTFLAIGITPLFMKLLAGKVVPVSGWGMFQSTVQIILLPVVLGALLKKLLPNKVVKSSSSVLAFLSVLGVTLINASIIGANAIFIKNSAPLLVLSLFLVHGGGFFFGYLLSKVLGYDKITNRTVSIEVGMQNSGLAAALARQHFANPATALPAAISATMHSILASILAAIWQLMDRMEDQKNGK